MRTGRPAPRGARITAAARAPQDGVHYHYVSREQFEAEIAEGKFLEHAHVHGNIYGTSWAAIQAVADAGKVCVLDIDVQGARSVRKAGARAIFVFVAPPSLEELERRLVGAAGGQCTAARLPAAWQLKARAGAGQ